jgi:hypothetical protein
MIDSKTLDLVNARKPEGSLRIFGNWFGRPFDDNHKVVSASLKGGHLVIEFESGNGPNTLEVWNPQFMRFNGANLEVCVATKVVHTWDYGQVTPARREYCVSNGHVVLSSNFEPERTIHWTTEPAVELIRR